MRKKYILPNIDSIIRPKWLKIIPKTLSFYIKKWHETLDTLETLFRELSQTIVPLWLRTVSKISCKFLHGTVGTVTQFARKCANCAICAMRFFLCCVGCHPTYNFAWPTWQSWQSSASSWSSWSTLPCDFLHGTFGTIDTFRPPQKKVPKCQ